MGCDCLVITANGILRKELGYQMRQELFVLCEIEAVAHHGLKIAICNKMAIVPEVIDLSNEFNDA